MKVFIEWLYPLLHLFITLTIMWIAFQKNSDIALLISGLLNTASLDLYAYLKNKYIYENSNSL